MIERLVSTLRLLASTDVGRGSRPAEIAGDYSDALRLVIDCPQIHLATAQRAALERVEDALDRGEAASRVAELARTAIAALGNDEEQDR